MPMAIDSEGGRRGGGGPPYQTRPPIAADVIARLMCAALSHVAVRVPYSHFV